jgi:hypothetical protein
MNLRSLQHVILAARALAEGKSILVLGSASLLASFPELGSPFGPLATTYDADILAEPFDELTSVMLHEALGDSQAYHRIHGYHADVLRDSVLQTLPSGWRDRLVPVPECEQAFAISPDDLAALKFLVGRPKDIDLLIFLRDHSIVKAAAVEKLIHQLNVPVEAMPRVLSNFKMVFGT